ncbi:hypothetical protein Tsubulata_047271 [Turnera subulata]|uniref:DNA-directed RNA polymerase III subunit RPC4 n=1 Tax=Turnera subulata TaxID=218843 RepID=A0A9Q0JCH7_9ROSI|nr:hypothetical protein Tsubulata_047271 [Turnera subulata]
MDSEPPKNVPRKLKFMPKSQPRRAPKPQPKEEMVEEVDVAQAENLMRHFNFDGSKNPMRYHLCLVARYCFIEAGGYKFVQASQIAFGFGAASSTLKSYGAPKRSSDRDAGSAFGGAHSSGHIEKEYKEPWDYYSYYPVTLPLRRPYSGNPETLNRGEFGEASETGTYNENSASPAATLDLMEETIEPRMLFLQLPLNLPGIKRSVAADSRSAQESSTASGTAGAAEKPCRLDQLPDGFMGKMLVYKSGAVKLKLGDVLYDVSPGMDCAFAQDVVAINTEEKEYCIVSEMNKRVTVIPDVDSILRSMEDL